MQKTYLYVYPSGEVVTGHFPPATATIIAAGVPHAISRACQQHLDHSRLFLRSTTCGFDLHAQQQIGLFRQLLRGCPGIEVIG